MTREIFVPNGITLTIATSTDERRAAIDFINTRMRNQYGGDAPPTSGFIITALSQGMIVGTIAMTATKGGVTFPIERNYWFDVYPFPCSRDRVIQGSRWTCTRGMEGLSQALVNCAMATAGAMGKDFMLIEAKPRPIELLQAMGMKCTELPGRLNDAHVLSVVKDEGMPYYRNPPSPRPWLLNVPIDAKQAWW
jgi:hypothetical protein